MFPCENVEKCSPTTSPSWFPGTGGIIKFHIQANVGSYAYKCDYHFELKVKFLCVVLHHSGAIQEVAWLENQDGGQEMTSYYRKSRDSKSKMAAKPQASAAPQTLPKL